MKAGERLPQADWGYDMRDGIVTLSHDNVLTEKPLLTLPGNYPAYYAGIRDAIWGTAPNPVPATEAIKVMELIELGIASDQQKKHCRSLLKIDVYPALMGRSKGGNISLGTISVAQSFFLFF